MESTVREQKYINKLLKKQPDMELLSEYMDSRSKVLIRKKLVDMNSGFKLVLYLILNMDVQSVQESISTTVMNSKRLYSLKIRPLRYWMIM